MPKTLFRDIIAAELTAAYFDRREVARRIFKELAIGEKSRKYSIEETGRAALDAILDSRPAESPTIALENDRLLSDTIESVIDDEMV